MTQEGSISGNLVSDKVYGSLEDDAVSGNIDNTHVSSILLDTTVNGTVYDKTDLMAHYHGASETAPKHVMVRYFIKAIP